MTDARTWKAELAHLESSQWPAYLDQHSGLPGPRANLSLLQVAATLADLPTIEVLLHSGSEYALMCAATALARRADTGRHETAARTLAAHQNWRVREGVAIGLQLLGDTAPDVLATIALDWVEDSDPLVQRAATAAICEPRLIRTPASAATAIRVCERATQHLAAMPTERRTEQDARTLRQALAYCWSVAVAADPEPGLAVFRALDTTDPDIRWIVNQNQRKKRLSALL